MGSASLKIARVASVASLAVVMSAGIVSAANASPSREAVPASCGSAGGGTWCHGSGSDGIWKGCFSNYNHPKNYHSSTAAIGGANDKRYASAGSWSNAHTRAGWAYTCYTYYNPNA